MRYLLVLGSIGCAFACTTICVGKGGTVDGSVIGVHTNDGEGDAVGNIHKILAADHTPGSIRPPGVLEVNHTYGYLSEGYPSMNEYQVGLAESTCSAVYVATSVAQGGKALLNIVQLGQIGLERAKTARETITVMGAIAEQYGYHGGGGYEGSGESLLVTDPNEAYIFHILPDFSQSAAIWVAQRVPDDHMAVVANCFTIRDVTLNDTQTFLFSSNLQDEAKRLGWTPAPTLDFTLLFSKGEYGHKYYSGRREWYAFLKLGDTPLPANYTDLVASKPYPATMKVSAKWGVEDVLAVMRSHYDGTEFDMSVGMRAGPWSSPDRWVGGEVNLPGGWFERPIATYRTIMATLTQSRAWLPDAVGGVLWAAPHAAHTSCFIPLPVGIQTVPDSYHTANGTLDRTKAFWVSRILFNVVQLKYNYIYSNVSDAIHSREQVSTDLVANMTAAYLNGSSWAGIEAAFLGNAADVVSTMATLGDTMIHNYADGYCHGCGAPGHELPYPKWWLEQVGFMNTTATEETTIKSAKSCIDSCPEHDSGLFKTCVASCVY